MNVPSGTSQPCRILIVEDEAVVALDLKSSLEQLNHVPVGIAKSAKEALLLVAEQRPDLVLMDIQLRGGKDGVWAAGEIRRRWNVPSVFITANTNDETMAKVKASAPSGFLNKPFRPKELDAVISIGIHQHRLVMNLFAERSWFATTMSSLSDGVIATDASGFVRFINPSAERITGWAKVDAMGKPIEEVYSLCTFGSEDLAECQIRKAIASGAPVPKSRFMLNVKGGGVAPVEDAASPIVEEGRVLGAVTTFVDITDRLRAEQVAAERQQELKDEVNLTTHALGQTREELQALSRHLMTAQEEERRRIARELHDDLGQRVALLGFEVANLGQAAPGSLQGQVETLRSNLNDLATGLREVSHRLHPAAIEDLGLAQALRALVSEYKAYDMTIGAKIDDVPEVPLQVATSLYRIAQESLQNVRKHAPDAPVHISLSARAGELVLRIEDTGLGFSLLEVRRKGGLGLISMQERARLAGGTLLLTARPNRGTTVLVRVKLKD